MIEYVGDIASLVALVIAFVFSITIFYNALISHREVKMKHREILYYRLFDETDNDEAEDRVGPYYED